VIAISNLYPYIIPYLPAEPPLSITHQQMIEAIRLFCRHSQAWRVDLAEIDIRNGVKSYELDAPIDDTEHVALVKVKYNGGEIFPGNDYTLSDDKLCIVLESEPDSDISGGLEIKMAIQPIPLATSSFEVDDRMFNDWHMCWAEGAKSLLMSQRKKGWSDANGSQEANAKFWDGIREAKNEVMRERTNKTNYARPKFKW
jgi:hypothetical protein